MSYIENLINDVNKTHSNLGELTALCQVITKAKKCLLIVSPSGCGKSTAMSFVGKNTSGNWMPSSISISSLGNKIEKLTSFRSVIVIDDIATIQTSYARITTITTLSALCYTHRVEPSMAGFDFAIEDFYGSALIGIQPIILRDIVLSTEWDATIKDKVLRYYHLYRPISPDMDLPIAQIERGIDIERVNLKLDTELPMWKELVKIGRSQWSIARTKEHLIDMLKAIASLEDRIEVIENDYALLYRLLKPMAIENIIVSKDSLEGERILDNNLLALLVEYYTYNGQFSLAHIAQDFNLRLAQSYRIMASQNGNWQQISKSPTIYKASKILTEMLKEFGLEINTEAKE